MATRALLEASSAVLLVLDARTGEIVDANRAACDFYGRPREELVGTGIQQINVMSPEEIAEELERARTRTTNYFRFRHRVAGGDVRSVEVHSGPFELDDRELLFSVVHDVTERDELEARLRRAQRLDTVGRLASGVAHDFNNLLTVMMACTDLIGRSLDEDAAARTPLADLDFALARAAELAKQLLVVGRGQVMREGPLDLAEVLEGMRRLLGRTLPDTIELEVHAAPTPPVIADRGQLEQVVLNLVLNAREAMPNGGRLVVSSCTEHVEEGHPAGHRPGPWAVLRVSDEGIGMDAHTRAHLFDPFFTTREGGTGLGLSTAYGIITQSRGVMDVISAPGEGATLVVRLPSAEVLPDPATDRPAPSAPEAPVDRPVLLVDDQDDVRDAMATLLTLGGYRVVAFGSTKEALAQREVPLDCLVACVTDVRMPEGNGFELARALRDRRPDIPILFVTGDLREHVREEAPPRAGFLQKPFRVSELLEALEAAMAME